MLPTILFKAKHTLTLSLSPSQANLRTDNFPWIFGYPYKNMIGQLELKDALTYQDVLIADDTLCQFVGLYDSTPFDQLSSTMKLYCSRAYAAINGTEVKMLTEEDYRGIPIFLNDIVTYDGIINDDDGDETPVHRYGRIIFKRGCFCIEYDEKTLRRKTYSGDRTDVQVIGSTCSVSDVTQTENQFGEIWDGVTYRNRYKLRLGYEFDRPDSLDICTPIDKFKENFDIGYNAEIEHIGDRRVKVAFTATAIALSAEEAVETIKQQLFFGDWQSPELCKWTTTCEGRATQSDLYFTGIKLSPSPKVVKEQFSFEQIVKDCGDMVHRQFHLGQHVDKITKTSRDTHDHFDVDISEYFGDTMTLTIDVYRSPKHYAVIVNPVSVDRETAKAFVASIASTIAIDGSLVNGNLTDSIENYTPSFGWQQFLK